MNILLTYLLTMASNTGWNGNTSWLRPRHKNASDTTADWLSGMLRQGPPMIRMSVGNSYIWCGYSCVSLPYDSLRFMVFTEFAIYLILLVIWFVLLITVLWQYGFSWLHHVFTIYIYTSGLQLAVNDLELTWLASPLGFPLTRLFHH